MEDKFPIKDKLGFINLTNNLLIEIFVWIDLHWYLKGKKLKDFKTKPIQKRTTTCESLGAF